MLRHLFSETAQEVNVPPSMYESLVLGVREVIAQEVNVPPSMYESLVLGVREVIASLSIVRILNSLAGR
jgi:hypothetical protein